MTFTTASLSALSFRALKDAACRASWSISAAGVPVTVAQFRILNTQTRRDAVVITFDMSLTAP
ncbi:MAG TPA: hypothetical protein VNO35_26515 [Steroidobacteraceae bacterium]|nr:hypothetical protein [Steroidobacteraceae bacterium]